MNLTHAAIVLGLMLGLSACAPAPCPGTNCAPIGWFTGHYTCNCAPPPAPPLPVPPPPPTERRGG